MKTQSVTKFLRICGFTLLATCLAVGFIRRSVDLAIPGRGVVRTVPTSFWGSLLGLFFDVKCEITYTPKNANEHAGKILLLHGFFERPIIVMPSTNDNVLLCLYDFDVGLRLLRIDMGKNFKPTLLTGGLDKIVFESPWEIDSGSGSDWMEALAYLENLSFHEFKRQAVPVFDLGVTRWYGGGPIVLSNAIIRQIRYQVPGRQSAQ